MTDFLRALVALLLLCMILFGAVCVAVFWAIMLMVVMVLDSFVQLWRAIWKRRE